MSAHRRSDDWLLDELRQDVEDGAEAIDDASDEKDRDVIWQLTIEARDAARRGDFGEARRLIALRDHPKWRSIGECQFWYNDQR
jgi:hypothetical protein